ncbi:YihY/virulence factor BrkB family protein [Nocardiopsis sp. MG754419]|uniref:YihY/virulence factor BrkB family protein n=1 Tax=Nocardiopsis sp. MG754419 TaxID=2259865 RepID=UPI001BA7931E|nr:YihY/virulence factor BrkB family protein [Nocardiopsis sp. MG754419]MBR8741482.1 YihY/virulence factor BrkB family protein [Nocardiopsis sp. MG754419]
MVGFWEGLWRLVDAWLRRHPIVRNGTLLVLRTLRALSRDRVVGLAAESAFFALISLPALLLCLLGALGPLAMLFGEDLVAEIREWILDLAARILTSDTVESVVEPLVDDFLGGVQGGVLSVTFLVSLWSGSRAMNVFIRSITISYGLDELRGHLGQRVLAFFAYLGGLFFAVLILPILVAGPDLVHDLLPLTVGRLNFFYWPVVGLVVTAAVTLLYALSVPVRTPLWRHLPGAALATVVLLGGSALLRTYLDASFGQVTIYGSLAAPIAILAWLYVMAIAVLVGSSLNSEIDALWPTVRTAAARAELANRHFERADRIAQRREQAVIDTINERNGR